MKDLDIIHHEERCNLCRNRATKLCDYPSGYWVSPHMIKKLGKVITCSRRMCDNCATNLGYETDFCPICMDKIAKLQKYNK